MAGRLPKNNPERPGPRSSDRHPKTAANTCLSTSHLPRTTPESREKSAHLRGGLRGVLESANVYALFKNLLRSKASRQRFVSEIIRPGSDSRILDIGCGDGWILEFLPSTVEYVGYDLNPDYIDRARINYGQRGTFVCAAISADSAPTLPGTGFDIVLALGLLHHLTDLEVAKLCEQAHAHLKIGGVFVTFDGVYVPGQSPIARFLISRDRGQMVRTPEAYLNLVGQHFSHVTSQVRTDLLRIPYTHFIMHCKREA